MVIGPPIRRALRVRFRHTLSLPHISYIYDLLQHYFSPFSTALSLFGMKIRFITY
jgi:hypothetical protein